MRFVAPLLEEAAVRASGRAAERQRSEQIFMRDSAAVLPSVSAHDEATRGFDVGRLLAPAQALTVYFAGATIAPSGIETVSLDDAFGRVLARAAVAREDHPSHARSTMDGYAVASDGALRWRVVGEVRMGALAPRAIGPGEALRIPTGGALPPGADAVIPQEDASLDGDALRARTPARRGDFFTQPGEDIRAGEPVLALGRRIGAPELGVLATLGFATVDVYCRPRVGIISTGDELVEPAAALHAGQVRDSNRYALAGALRALGATPFHLPRSGDTLEELRAAVREGLAASDALVLTGGSSVGARDLVPRVVAELGAPGALVHGIRVKPGKPTLLGAVGPKPVIGLPGNPTSSLMIFEAIVSPIVYALTGERASAPACVEAIASEAFVGREGWTWYVPARLQSRGGTLEAQPLPLRSAHTSLLARAFGYAIVGEQPARIEAGARVAVYRFGSGGAPIESA